MRRSTAPPRAPPRPRRGAATPGGETRGNLTGTAEALEATIDGSQEVPAVATAATGNGLAVISSDGTSVGYAVTYGGLSGALAAAHIHTGAPGVAGGVILPPAGGPGPVVGGPPPAGVNTSRRGR